MEKAITRQYSRGFRKKGLRSTAVSTLKQQLNPSEGGMEKPAGKARQRVMPRHGEAEQRSQTVSPPRQRAGSGLTQWVSVIEAQNISQHVALRGSRSGQLLFQGSRLKLLGKRDGAHPCPPTHNPLRSLDFQIVIPVRWRFPMEKRYRLTHCTYVCSVRML